MIAPYAITINKTPIVHLHVQKLDLKRDLGQHRIQDKENLSRGHGEDRESWTRGMTC